MSPTPLSAWSSSSVEPNSPLILASEGSPDEDINLKFLSIDHNVHSTGWDTSNTSMDYLSPAASNYPSPNFINDMSGSSADAFSPVLFNSPSSGYSFRQEGLPYPVEDVFNHSVELSQHTTEFSYASSPTMSSLMYPPEHSIVVEDADIQHSLQVDGDPIPASNSGIFHLSVLAQMNGFPSIPNERLSAPPNPQNFPGTTYTHETSHSHHIGSRTQDMHSFCTGDEDMGPQKPQAMRKSLMRHYRTFFDEHKVLRMFGKAAKERVSTLNGLRASASRRKNPAKFFCDWCQSGFTRKHNLDNHMKSHFGITDLACQFCSKAFTTIPVQKRHQETCQSNPNRKAAAASRS